MALTREEYYRRRAEECMRDVDEAPQYMKLKLLSIAQQWNRLAEFTAASETETDSAPELDVSWMITPDSDQPGAN